MATKRICTSPSCGKPHHSFGLCQKHSRRAQKRGDILGATKHGEVEAFFNAALVFETDECIKWPYGTFAAGYGALTVDGEPKGAHRMVCIASYGPPPSDLHEAAHSCGFPACVNKRHLRWATRAENMADKLAHGTSNEGEKHPNAKLTAEQVITIRQLVASGMKQRAVASAFGIHIVTVSGIHLRRRWTHI